MGMYNLNVLVYCYLPVSFWESFFFGEFETLVLCPVLHSAGIDYYHQCYPSSSFTLLYSILLYRISQ